MSRKVKFRDDYNGCFKEFKGRALTVVRSFYCTDNDSCYWYIIKELLAVEKYHLCKSHHFQRIDGTKIR